MQRISRRRFLANSIALSAAFRVGVSWAQPKEAPVADANPEKTAAEFYTADARAAVEKGLGYLAKQQQEDGSFGSGGDSRNVAVCALSGIAFLSAGSTPGRGPHGKQTAKCVDYLLDHTEQSGFISVAAA